LRRNVSRGTTQIVLYAPLIGRKHALCINAAYTGDAYYPYAASRRGLRVSGSEGISTASGITGNVKKLPYRLAPAAGSLKRKSLLPSSS